jgi:uncharacterized protein (TIGR03083 family)
MTIDEDAALVAERRALLETLEALEPADWDRPSLCPGWRVRDVAAHASSLILISPPALIWGLIRNRGDFNRFAAGDARRRGGRPIGDILADVRTFAATAKIAPTARRVDMALDAFVHHHDIALPLGRTVPSDPARLRWLADGMVATGRPILAGPRVEGLRLVSTDIDWHYGTGPEITGPAAALMLAGCGRRALDHQLSGPGLAELQSR